MLIVRHNSSIYLCNAGLLSLDEIVQMRKPRCGDTDEKPDADSKTGSRSKRWAKLGSNLWPSDMMPLQISVDRGIPGFDKTTVENIALECAKVSLHHKIKLLFNLFS